MVPRAEYCELAGLRRCRLGPSLGTTSGGGLDQGNSYGAGAGVYTQRRAEPSNVRLLAVNQRVAEVVRDLSRQFGSGAVHYGEGLERRKGAPPASTCPGPWGRCGPCPEGSPLHSER